MRYARCVVLRFIIVGLVFSLTHVQAENERNRSKICSAESASMQCKKYERCVQSSKDATPTCQCLLDYELVNDECVPQATPTLPNIVTTVKVETETSSGGGSVAAGLLIPTFLIVAGVVLYFGARRYKWLQRFRQYRQNRYGNVLVTRDDDDDDDPIA